MKLEGLLAAKRAELDPRSGVYLITPEIAQELLSGNGAKNRTLGWRKVATLGAAMRTHRWGLTGESIKLDLKGNLYDGQHRLTACVETGKAFLTVVVFGKWDFQNMGQGKVRSGADVLSIRGVPNTTSLASAIRFILLHERGYAKGAKNPYTAGATGFKDSIHNKALDWKIVTNEDVDGFEMKADPSLQDLHRIIAKSAGKSSLIPLSPALAAYYLIINNSGVEREKVDKWFYGLMSGDSLGIQDPRFQLRKKVEHVRTLVLKGKTGHMKSEHVFADICWAWNNRGSRISSWRRKVGSPLEYIATGSKKKFTEEVEEVAEEATV